MHIMRNKKTKGFALIDLLVSASIVSVVFSVVLFSYRSFSNRIAVASAAQEAAIVVRQAQTYSSSVRERSQSSGNFTTGYGISFSKNDPTAYYLFADENDNKIYDGDSTCAPGSECVEKGRIRNGVGIVEVCGIEISEVRACPPLSAQGVSVVFPPYIFQGSSPDATITYTDNVGAALVGGSYVAAQIVMALQGEEESIDLSSSVTVNKAGQIHTQIHPLLPGNNNPPVIALIGANPLNVTTGPGPFVDPGATATDVEDGDITADIEVNGTVNTLIPATYELVYSVTDSAGVEVEETRNVVVAANECQISDIQLAGTISTGGWPIRAQVVGNYAYVLGVNFEIYDVTNPASPVFLGSTTPPYMVSDMTISGNYAYVVGQYDSLPYKNLFVINISNPANPTLAGDLFIAGQLRSVKVSGNYAYILRHTGILDVVDISNPASPVSVNSFAAGFGNDLAINGSYLYLSDTTGPVVIKSYNISVPANPVLAGSIAGYYSFSHAANGKLYTVDLSGSMFRAYDIAGTPATPAYLGELSTGTMPIAVFGQGSYAFVAKSSASTMQVIDMSSGTPVSVGSVPVGIQPYSIFVSGGKAYMPNISATGMVKIFNLGCFSE